MKRGITLIELLIAIGATATIAIMATIFMYQTLVSRDKALATSEATEVANSVLARIKASVPQATNLTIDGGGTALHIEEDTGCEEFTLTSGRINYEQNTNPCPIAVTAVPITNATANVTNSAAPVITLFTGSPADTDALTVTTSIRVRVNRPFASSEVTLRDSVSRRR